MNYRHGDIRLKKIERIPDNSKKLKDKILAYGEVTGHTHRFENPNDIERYQFDNKLYLQVFKPTQLIHEEHKSFIVEPGIYEQIQEREYDPFQKYIRAVID